MNFRILTYNIHKGYGLLSRVSILDQIRQSVRIVNADLLCLQEVSGSDHHSQFEFLADEVWPHTAYGKNAITSRGHHGNAILSRYPMLSHTNEDVSFSKLERRGILHSQIQMPSAVTPLHVFCVHLGLFEKDRIRQITKITNLVHSRVPADAPLIIAGDFNDWNQSGHTHLIEKLDVKEAFLNLHGHHAKTFPNRFPFLPLDRVYYRNLNCIQAIRYYGREWGRLSDHLPILAEFKW